jgi:general secretion pathway protein G
MTNVHSRRKAFTLIEVILVVAILVMLAGGAIVGYTAIQKRAEKNYAKTLVAQASNAVNLYRLDMKRLPTDDDGLKALVTKPSDDTEAELWAGPYLKDGVIPRDPWGDELKYKSITRSGDEMGPEFEVFSYGPDKQEGTEDDISSAPEAQK